MEEMTCDALRCETKYDGNSEGESESEGEVREMNEKRTLH